MFKNDFTKTIEKFYRDIMTKYVVNSAKRQALFKDSYREYTRAMTNLAIVYNDYVRLCNSRDFDLVCAIFGVCVKPYKRQFDTMKETKIYTSRRHTMIPSDKNVGINDPNKIFNFLRDKCSNKERLYSKAILNSVNQEIYNTKLLTKFLKSNITNMKNVEKINKLRSNFFNDGIIKDVFPGIIDPVIKLIRKNYICFSKYMCNYDDLKK